MGCHGRFEGATTTVETLMDGAYATADPSPSPASSPVPRPEIQTIQLRGTGLSGSWNIVYNGYSTYTLSAVPSADGALVMLCALFFFFENDNHGIATHPCFWLLLPPHATSAHMPGHSGRPVF